MSSNQLLRLPFSWLLLASFLLNIINQRVNYVITSYPQRDSEHQPKRNKENESIWHRISRRDLNSPSSSDNHFHRPSTNLQSHNNVHFANTVQAQHQLLQPQRRQHQHHNLHQQQQNVQLESFPLRYPLPPPVPAERFNQGATLYAPQEDFGWQGVINQDQSINIERFMKNLMQDSDGFNRSALNLASFNDRATQVDFNQNRGAQPATSGQQFKATQTAVQISSPHQDTTRAQRRLDNGEQSNREDQISARGDFLVPNKLRPTGKSVIPTGAVTGPLKPMLVPPVAHLPHKPVLGHLKDNCITKSMRFASECEDHLVRRLNQDATEGRTVIDVERRVCCALFWHKDCINRIVLQNCPDSSPVAAQVLLGPRSFDLTTSCQNFNRDGCNGSPSSPMNHLSAKLLFVLSTTLSLIMIIKTFGC